MVLLLYLGKRQALSAVVIHGFADYDRLANPFPVIVAEHVNQGNKVVRSRLESLAVLVVSRLEIDHVRIAKVINLVGCNLVDGRLDAFGGGDVTGGEELYSLGDVSSVAGTLIVAINCNHLLVVLWFAT